MGGEGELGELRVAKAGMVKDLASVFQTRQALKTHAISPAQQDRRMDHSELKSSNAKI